MSALSDNRWVLILAGGRGERFWPWSTPDRPKQLLPLASGRRTLLGATFERALRLCRPERVLVMTSMDLIGSCQRECPGAQVYGEPMMRNTAPAIAAAAASIPDEHAFAVLPSDHAIEDEDAFTLDMERAFAAAEHDPVLVTFGIRPTEPETSFGYIRSGAKLGERQFRVAQFTEKPDRERAAQWIATGEYFWNTGMFVWKRKTFFDALAATKPDMARALRSFRWEGGPAAFGAALRPVFEPLESISVDYAVLEKAPNTVMIQAAFDWNDLGSWSAWARLQPKDARGNVRFGDSVLIDCDGCVVVSEGGTAAALGLKDTVVVHVNGASLSCPLAMSEQVRRVSEAVRNEEWQ